MSITVSTDLERWKSTMKISYKPLWKTLIDKNMSKKDLRLRAHLTTNHIANKNTHPFLMVVQTCATTLEIRVVVPEEAEI